MRVHNSRNLILVLLAPLLSACTDQNKQPLKESDLSTQRQEATFAGKLFASTSFRKGLPELPIGTPQLTETMHAVITIPDFFGKIYVCLGRTSDEKLFSYLALHIPSGDITVRDLRFDEKGEVLRTSSGVPLDPDKRTFFPIDIRVDLSKATLYYRWTLSPEDSPIPGGIPTAPTNENPRVALGRQFPNLSVADLRGSQIETKSFLGRVTVINRWATWCKPCIDEISGFNTLADKYSSNVLFLKLHITGGITTLPHLKWRSLDCGKNYRGRSMRNHSVDTPFVAHGVMPPDVMRHCRR